MRDGTALLGKLTLFKSIRIEHFETIDVKLEVGQHATRTTDSSTERRK
jgi:hypothetical protein